MRSAAKQWFTPEVKRAGWISAVTCMIPAVLHLWFGSVARGLSLAIVYAMLPAGLGCIAVGALNFRRWHGFRESMEACVAAVVNVYNMLGVFLLMALAYSVLLGPLFLYALVLVIYWSVVLAFYLAGMFFVAVLAAWAAGAALYGLLWLMQYVGQLGRTETHGEGERPRALRMVV